MICIDPGHAQCTGQLVRWGYAALLYAVLFSWFPHTIPVFCLKSDIFLFGDLVAPAGPQQLCQLYQICPNSISILPNQKQLHLHDLL
jgi:hypothetical protein